MTVGEKIRDLRKKREMTQLELAEKAGVARVTVGFYERGERLPSIDIAARIADALDVPVSTIFDDEEIDRDYELVCDTLTGAGFKVEAAGVNYGGGPDFDMYYISHADADGEEEKDREEIEYYRLIDIVKKVLKDAEANRAAYIQRRLEVELFWPKGYTKEEPKK